MKPFKINYLQECITFELSFKNKLCIMLHFIDLLVNHTVNLQTFTTSLEFTLQVTASKNPFLSLVLCNFNAKN